MTTSKSLINPDQLFTVGHSIKKREHFRAFGNPFELGHFRERLTDSFTEAGQNLGVSIYAQTRTDWCQMGG
jgi:hypothetical protein